MTWLHWTLMFMGGLVAYGVAAYPFCCWLGRKFRAMEITDPAEKRRIALDCHAASRREG